MKNLAHFAHFLLFLSRVFTRNGLGVGIVIGSTERCDVVKIKCASDLTKQTGNFEWKINGALICQKISSEIVYYVLKVVFPVGTNSQDSQVHAFFCQSPDNLILVCLAV